MRGMKPIVSSSAARPLRTGLVIAAVLAASGAQAASAPPLVTSAQLRTEALAATCAQCHGTDGRSVSGLSVPALAGQPRDDLVLKLQAFRAGQKPSTVMGQLVKGLTDEQIGDVARYFSGLAP